jgi:hypothetical protein
MILFPPSAALAMECTLSVLSGEAEIQNRGAESWLQGSDGMTVKAGTRIKTASNSNALLTFFNGTSTKLEANTDLEILRVEHTDEKVTTIIMKQWLGTTWSYVQKEGHESRYFIETPTARATAHGTLFTTEVDERGSTKVVTVEGLVSVSAQGEEVFLPANYQTEVEAGVKPKKPLPSPPSKTEIVITIDMPAIGSVIDPSGSSTGCLPSGFAYNQITGSKCWLPSEGTQTIIIRQPVSGTYIIALRYLLSGTAYINIKCNTGSETVIEYSGLYEAESKDGWLLYFDLQFDNDKIIGCNLVNVEPIGEKAPEKLVIKGSSEATTVPLKPFIKGLSQDTDKGQDKGQGQSSGQDTGKGQDKGQGQGSGQDTGKGQDKGQGQGSGQDTGQGQDKGQGQGSGQDTGQGQDKGQGQSSSQDTGNGQDKGQGQGSSQDTGKGQDNGQGQGSGQDTGKGQDKGQDQGSGQDTGKGQDKGQGSGQDTGKGQEKGQGSGQDTGQGQGKVRVKVRAKILAKGRTKGKNQKNDNLFQGKLYSVNIT